MSSVKPASRKTKASDISVIERLGLYAKLVRIDRPIGILLLLWPTLWALWIAAGGFPGWTLLLVFVTGTVLTRSAGCAVNDFADRHIDRHVERTRERPLTSGLISSREALLVAVVLALLAFLLLFFTNGKTMLMSLVAVVLAVIYPFSKRFTHLPQVFLGAAFSWGIPMAYTAVGVPLTRTTWLLFIASVLWALVYDTLYAMVDREDDLKIGVKSTAILFGDADVTLVTLIHIIVLLALVLAGHQEGFGIWYHLATLFGAGFILRQYLFVRHRDRQRCFRGFLDNNYFGLAIFAGIVAHYLLSTPVS
ncbi:4-hydroxybenzoate octaprenyltransferase [Granulosicoccaceae sp. 1_MG-2023]|nr:4-hydroxybenzoate octaprenyltransferase [Granulosicoccaceae sp. 1_MG-2023]